MPRLKDIQVQLEIMEQQGTQSAREAEYARLCSVLIQDLTTTQKHINAGYLVYTDKPQKQQPRETLTQHRLPWYVLAHRVIFMLPILCTLVLLFMLYTILYVSPAAAWDHIFKLID